MSDEHQRAVAGRIAVAAFVLGGLAALALAAVYWRGGNPQLEGTLLAAAFGAIGGGLVVWANRVLPQGPYVEARHPLPSEPAERARFADEATRGVARRTLLVRGLGFAAAAVGLALAFPLRSLGPKPGRALLRTPWQRGVRLVTADGRPVRSVDVPLDGLLTVFPEGHPGSADGQAVLVRVRPELLRLEPAAARGAPQGYVAYSKVCTHAGCPVGLYQTDTHELLCPCHQSSFDVLEGAKPVFGPAAWPLPQLPLTIDDQGVLRAAGDFSAPVGPGWWRA